MGEYGHPPETGASLGTCPRCTGTIPSSQLLMRYEPPDGWPRIFAECPVCDVVVHPE